MYDDDRYHSSLQKGSLDNFNVYNGNGNSFDAPIHATPIKSSSEQLSNNGFTSPVLGNSTSKSSLLKEVIAEIDKEILNRKKELSALRSRSASKRRLNRRSNV